MNPFVVLAVSLGVAGVVVQPLPVSYNFSWHTVGEAIVGDSARGSWTIERQVVEESFPKKIANNSLGVDLTAESAVILDKETNTVLWQKNKEDKRAIGSITKLMTALVFLDHNPGWEETITVLQSDRTVGGRQHLYSGDQITLRDIFNSALVASDNDAAKILARSTGLSSEEFVKAMNDKASILGLDRTDFADPTGLSALNLSTATEVVQLASIAFEQEDIRKIANSEEYSFVSKLGREYNLEATNKLLGSFVDIRAAKTGFIPSAGYCIVAEVEDDGNTILVAILGSSTNADRFQDLKMLSYWTFENFEWL